jgi:hypothetical protein
MRRISWLILKEQQKWFQVCEAILLGEYSFFWRTAAHSGEKD